MQRYFKGLIWALATWITSQTIMRQKGLVFDSRLWFGGGGAGFSVINIQNLRIKRGNLLLTSSCMYISHLEEKNKIQKNSGTEALRDDSLRSTDITLRGKGISISN